MMIALIVALVAIILVSRIDISIKKKPKRWVIYQDDNGKYYARFGNNAKSFLRRDMSHLDYYQFKDHFSTINECEEAIKTHDNGNMAIKVKEL